jgi:uncharacterized membrane protein YhaH (DUF805 family)
MKHAAALAMVLLDPRGRIGRRDLLLSACVVLSLEFLLLMPSSEVIAVPAKGLALWIAMAALIKRLHDLDYSGWWVPAGLGGLCIWTALLAMVSLLTVGQDAFLPGTTANLVLLGLIMLPAAGITLWLHLSQGDAAANRYGAPAPSWPPNRLSPSGQIEADGPARA